MSMIEKFMIGETEIEIYDDCCCYTTEEEVVKVLNEIEWMTKEYYTPSRKQAQL